MRLVCCWVSLLLAVAAPSPSRAATRATYSTVNLMPAFWHFWDQAKDLPASRQYPLFKRRVMDRYPAVYNEQVLGNESGKPFAEAFPARYAKVVEMWIRPHLATIRRLSDEIETELPKQDRRFRAAFPDMAYRGKVYFIASIGGFDGATREVNGEEALLFGLDSIAGIYGDAADISPLFTHELFHLYHAQFFRAGADPKQPDPLWAALWREGLAVYVTQQLNPKASDLDLFGLPTNTPERVRAQLPRLAARLRGKLGSTDRDDYAAFFLGGMKRDADPPSRCGYYLGYLVAKKLSAGKTLRALAHWHGPALEKAITAAVEALEKGR